MSKIVVAIDGPSGSGKSSVSRAVAKQLGLQYLDTGAMYRAMTWAVINAGVDPKNSAAVVDLASKVEIIPSIDPANPGIKVGTTDVSEPIRGDEVTGAVSAVSAVPEVRTLLVKLQRELTEAAPNGIVVEGRDIGSVVLPNAHIKLYLTADQDARALRRAVENGDDIAKVQDSINKRDKADSTRAVSPLEMAEDATLLDTTHMELSEVIDYVLNAIAGVKK